ncbi:MAG: glycosyltransferase family 4 protein, partial [Bacteroidales bacterium]|nr:glycosyltransferase family 4 protein [Bacteroidales bacterium]
MTDQKKKICLVIPSLHAGGMERVMSELANFMAAKDNVQLYLVLYGKNPSVFYNLPLNLQVHKPDYTFRESLRLWFTLRALFFLRQEIKHIQPD